MPAIASASVCVGGAGRRSPGDIAPARMNGVMITAWFASA